jgi:hypothetical protein
VKLDMPGTSSGVDVFPDAASPLDTAGYALRLKNNGVAIHKGQSAVVTKVHVKEKLIEFQLDGGGFGTLGDDTNTVVVAPYQGKSDLELDLERRIKTEKDAARKKNMQRELNELRYQRERDNARNRVDAEAASEQKKQRIALQRLQGGSRFNIRYQNGVPPGLRPDGVLRALAEYVEFSPPNAAVPHARGGAAPPSPARRSIQKGLSMADVQELFGKPDKTTERMEGTLRVVTATYTHDDQRVTAEFVEGVVVRYSITSR